jgi:hypothetical protein
MVLKTHLSSRGGLDLSPPPKDAPSSYDCELDHARSSGCEVPFIE